LSKKLANFLENSDFWQRVPNLAPSGNPDATREQLI